jgi:hypothetical protein
LLALSVIASLATVMLLTSCLFAVCQGNAAGPKKLEGLANFRPGDTLILVDARHVVEG